MQFRRLGKTAWEVSAIGLGCGTHVESWSPEEERNFIDTVHKAMDLGINFFDTADSYNTERWLGKALGSRRSDAYIATKVGKYAADVGHPLSYKVPEHIILCCEASLHRLGTDYIDLYQCHLEDPKDVDVFLEAFDRLKQMGLIRHFGASTNDVDVLQAFNKDGECATCQFDYNMLRPKPEQDLLPYCDARHIGAIVRRPLEKGILTGTMTPNMQFKDWVRKRWNEGPEREDYQTKVYVAQQLSFLETSQRSMAQASLAYILSHPAVSCAIPGASKPQRLDGYVEALRTPLEEGEVARIRSIVGGTASSC